MTSYIVGVEATITAWIEVDADTIEEAIAYAPQRASDGGRIPWEYGSPAVQTNYRRDGSVPLAFEAWAPCEIATPYGTPWCMVHDSPQRQAEGTCYAVGEVESAAGLHVPIRMDGGRPCWCRHEPGPVLHTRYCDAMLEAYPRARSFGY